MIRQSEMKTSKKSGVRQRLLVLLLAAALTLPACTPSSSPETEGTEPSASTPYATDAPTESGEPSGTESSAPTGTGSDTYSDTERHDATGTESDLGSEITPDDTGTITEVPPGTVTDAPESTTKPAETSGTASTTKPVKPETPLPETYKIPAVYITTDSGKPIDSREEYVTGTVRIDGRDSGFDSLPTLTAQIRGRGHYSWGKEKKPYKIKFDESVSVLGLASARQWVLSSNHSDKTLMRNYIVHQMGKVLTNLAYHPTQYLVEVYLNGEYLGVYTMGEQLQVKGNRIDIDEDYEDPNTGYLLEIGGVDTDTDVRDKDYFFAGYARWVRIKSPNTAEITDAHVKYIKNYLEKTDAAIRAGEGYEEYIDVPSFIDWAIIHEISYNIDSSFRRSCFMVKDKDGLLKMGPAWDFDLGFGNFFKDNPNYDDFSVIGPDKEDILDMETLKGIKPGDYSYDDYYVLVTWFNYLMADDAFYAKYQARWNEIKEALYSAAMTSIDKGRELLSDGAWARNFTRWDVSQRVGSEPKFASNYKTLDAQVGYLRDFIIKRYQWLDKALNTPR